MKMSRFTILVALVLMCVSGGESCGGGAGRRSPPRGGGGVDELGPPAPGMLGPVDPPAAHVFWCNKCDDWYMEEKFDDWWRVVLNNELPCPCRAKFTRNGEVQPERHNPFATWTTDSACHPDDGMPFETALCDYHPGAHGCMRSTSTHSISTDNARQQCCYDRAGDILKPPHRGAGTPDKERRLDRHLDADVYPYNWCCKYCSSKCYKYLGRYGVRTGDASHCP